MSMIFHLLPRYFATVNKELMNINDWFIANKLSLNVGKTKYSLLHKSSRVDNLPLKLPKLSINNQEIKRAYYTKFLGVLLDENLSWKEYTISIITVFFLHSIIHKLCQFSMGEYT